MTDNIKQTMTNARLKMGIVAAVKSKMCDLMVSVGGLIADLTNRITDIQVDTASTSYDPAPVANTAVAAINVVADRAKAQIAATAEEIDASRKYLTMFEIEHNITWKAAKQNVLMSCLAFLAMAGVEGIMTAMFFLNGGYVSGVAEALALGLMISGVNIVLSGLLGGGFFGKFWNYGLNAREDSRAVRTKRLVGRICSVMVGVLVAFVILVTGIVRATGEPEQLAYSFESISTAASDFHSVLLWTLGLAFAILSWRKGLSAFSSSYPGLSEASKAVVDGEELVKILYDDALAEVDGLYDDAIQDLEDMAEDVAVERQELIDDLRDAQRHREQVLVAISKAESDFSTFQAEQISIYAALSEDSEVPVPMAFDAAAWRSKLPPVVSDISAHSSGFSTAHNQAREHISNARQAAIHVINDAYKNTFN